MKTTWRIAALAASLALMPSSFAVAASAAAINLVACQHFYTGPVPDRPATSTQADRWGVQNRELVVQP